MKIATTTDIPSLIGQEDIRSIEPEVIPDPLPDLPPDLWFPGQSRVETSIPGAKVIGAIDAELSSFPAPPPQGALRDYFKTLCAIIHANIQLETLLDEDE